MPALIQSGALTDLNRAIERLRQEAQTHTLAAGAESDLAAAYLVRAGLVNDPRDLLLAYEAADRAVQTSGSLPEARFNRALALEKLSLLPAARKAWQDYLQLDEGSPWSREVQEHLNDLLGSPHKSAWKEQLEWIERAGLAGDGRKIGEIVKSWRQAAREYGEDELLGLWADAAAQGQTVMAVNRLQVTRALGEALMGIGGDAMVRDAVAAIHDAAWDPVRLQKLVQGHRDFRDGRKLYAKRDVKAAEVKLGAALTALAQGGSPLSLRASFLLACNDYIAGRYEPSRERLDALAREVAERPYYGLRAHLLQMQALVHAVQGRMMAAIDRNEKALAEFRRLGEEENVAAQASLLGESLGLVGSGHEAWDHVYQALVATREIRDAATRSMVYMTAANLALRDGLFDAALAFQTEAVRCSRQSSPLRRVETLTFLARLQGRLEPKDLALTTVSEARRLAELLDPPRVRARKVADLAMIEGSLIARDDPGRAITLLTSALAVYSGETNQIFLLWTRLARARAHREAGDDAAARTDLEAALGIYDRMGWSLDGEGLRLAFLAETDEAFDEMIALQAEHDPDLALAYADRARTRVLPGSASKLWTGTPADTGQLLAAEPPQALGPDEIRRRLPADTVLIQFAVLPDRVLIWRLRRGETGEGLWTRSIPKKDLDSRVSAVRRHESKAASELFDLLIRPWLRPADAGRQLVVVPDKVLHRVPFAALKDAVTGRYLIEDHSLVMAPSASLYLDVLARGRERRAGGPRGLVVGEPAIDRERFYTLASLPAAAEEAARLTALTGAAVLLGKAADKPSFIAAAQRADWIHFAGHAVIDPRNNLLSSLVLAPGAAGDPGTLTAREIYSLDLRTTRLVVLAACDTGDERSSGSEGTTSLARAFLAAGVHSVAASLWDVGDRPAAAMSHLFHRNLLDGLPPAEALRRAQLAMLHGSDETGRSPAAWGAFAVFGASAD